MLRTPSRTAIPASLVMLAAVFIAQASPSAADECLPAPKGAAPQGQHWYYHLDRATQRKCWYLHETIAKPAARAAAPAARANSAAQPAAPAATGRPAERAAPSPWRRDASAQPSGASNGEANASRSEEATGATAAPALNAAPPLQPASEPMAAQGGSTLSSDAPQPASTGAQDAPGATGDSAPTAASTPTDAGDTTMEDALAQSDKAPVTAAAPESASSHSVAQDLLILALAAILAGVVSVAVAVLRGRKPMAGKLAHFIELAAGLIDAAFAKFAGLRRRKRTEAKYAEFAPSIDESWRDRQDDWRPKPRSCKDGSPQPKPAQTSLIPEQITMARPFVAPRQQARVNRDRRARVE